MDISSSNLLCDVRYCFQLTSDILFIDIISFQTTFSECTMINFNVRFSASLYKILGTQNVIERPCVADCCINYCIIVLK